MLVDCVGGQGKAEAVGQDCQYEESMGGQGTEFSKMLIFFLGGGGGGGARSNLREHLKFGHTPDPPPPPPPLGGMTPHATSFPSPQEKILLESLSTALSISNAACTTKWGACSHKTLVDIIKIVNVP